jgi:hypothetical protein
MRSTLAWPSERERLQINKAIKDLDVTKATLVVEPDSPWLQIDVWVHLEGERKFALWRYTGAVYNVDEHGAVVEDPFIKGWDAAPDTAA